MQTGNHEAMLDVMIPVFSVLCLAWIVFATIGLFRRRAYNLTSAESAGARRITPDFLRIDRAKREAALAAGTVFDAARTPAASPDIVAPSSRIARVSRLLALVSAILTFVAAAFAAVDKMETVQGVYDRMTASVHEFVDVIARHQVGFAFATAVIAVNFGILVIRLVRGPTS